MIRPSAKNKPERIQVNGVSLALIIEESDNGDAESEPDSVFSSAWSSYVGERKEIGAPGMEEETASARLRRVEDAMLDEGPATW